MTVTLYCTNWRWRFRRPRPALRPAVFFLAAPAAAGTEIGLGADVRPGMLDHRDQPRHHRLHRDRLGEELVGAGVARLAHMIELGIARQHDDRHKGIGRLAGGAHHLDDVDARHPRHHPVHHDHVGIGFAQHLPGAFAVHRLENLDDAEGLQDRDDELAHMLAVVDNQNLQPVETIAAAHLSSHTVLGARPRGRNYDGGINVL